MEDHETNYQGATDQQEEVDVDKVEMTTEQQRSESMFCFNKIVDKVFQDSPLGFSFPLRGFRSLWRENQVVDIIGQQVVFFVDMLGSKYLLQAVETK